jgi:hypothetical protein
MLSMPKAISKTNFNFSGQLDVEGILPTRSVFATHKLVNTCEQTLPNNDAPSRNRCHERGEEARGTNIVTASLV